MCQNSLKLLTQAAEGSFDSGVRPRSGWQPAMGFNPQSSIINSFYRCTMCSASTARTASWY